eukprot:14837881-Alexandrium_andersonii.AAC.1
MGTPATAARPPSGWPTGAALPALASREALGRGHRSWLQARAESAEAATWLPQASSAVAPPALAG